MPPARGASFDWNQARAFLATAEAGSLTAAAKVLGMTQPTLGRQVEALQADLGVVLFERHGRGLRLTPSGVSLLAHVRAMGEAAARLSLSASGQVDDVVGPVCISAGEAVAALRLPRVLAQLKAQAPGIVVEVVASNAPSDLKRREADIAIRNFRPREGDLVARKIRDVGVRLYAHPAYLAQVQDASTPAGLARADFIGFDSTSALREALAKVGLVVDADRFRALSESHLVGWELVKAGLGIGVMQEDIGDDEPQVVRALPSLPPIVIPVWLTAHREVQTSRRVRLVFDFLAEALAREGSGTQ